MRQQSKEVTKRFMTAYQASFQDPGSSTSNPITISDSPSIPSTSANPPPPTSPPVSSRTRARSLWDIKRERILGPGVPCDHRSRVLVAVKEKESVYECGLCAIYIKVPRFPNKNS